MIRKKWSRLAQNVYQKCYCTKNVAEILPEPDNIPKPSANRNTHSSRIYNFFQNENFNTVKKYIPRKYFTNTIKPCDARDIYLICPEVAKRIAKIMLEDLEIPQRNDYVVCDSNPGIGMIAQELLDGGLQSIRLYEGCADFRVNLHDFVKLYNSRVRLFQKDLFNISAYTYMDKMDYGHRIDDMLADIPQKNWSDDPAMVIVGVLGSLKFLKYLNRSLALHTGLMTLGRVQLYAVLRPQDVMVLTAKRTDKLSLYKAFTVLFQSFFDIEVLEAFPRKLFLPWLKKEYGDVYTCVYGDLNLENMYLVKITSKKELPLPIDKLMLYYYFIIQTFSKSGNSPLIPTLEKWTPGIGETLISSNINGIYPEDLGVFTKLRELDVDQIIEVFKQAVNHPNFQTSTFERLIEQSQVRNLTTDTELHEALNLKAGKVKSNENK